MQTLIIVTGAPATGKSLLAAQIARRYACALLSKDAIKEAMFDTLGTGDAAWSRRLSDASFAAMFAAAAASLESGASVLLEGNFRPGEHDPHVRALLGSRAPACIQVLCHVPEQVRQARLMARASAPLRHAGHLDAAMRTETNSSGFLDVPSLRIEFDSATGAGSEKLFGALDARVQHGH